MRKATFRAPVLEAAVGIYLPLELSVPIFLGVCSPRSWRAANRSRKISRACCLPRLITGRISGWRADRHSDRGHPSCDVFALPARCSFGGGVGRYSRSFFYTVRHSQSPRSLCTA